MGQNILPQWHGKPVRPSFFLQTPHLFFLGLLGLSLFVFLPEGVPSSSDNVEQMESSFLRFELDEGFGVIKREWGEVEEVVATIGTGALLAILALVLFGERLELFREWILFEFEDIAIGVEEEEGVLDVDMLDVGMLEFGMLEVGRLDNDGILDGVLDGILDAILDAILDGIGCGIDGLLLSFVLEFDCWSFSSRFLSSDL